MFIYKVLWTSSYYQGGTVIPEETHCTNDLDTSSLILDSPLKKRRKGGVRARTRRRSNKFHLPSIFLGNVQSLNNKVDELCARKKCVSDCRNASVLCLIETLLKSDTPNTDVETDGCIVYRGDRSVDSRKELRTGGVCLFVNNMWCNNVTVNDNNCTPKLELLVVSCKP